MSWIEFLLHHAGMIKTPLSQITNIVVHLNLKPILYNAILVT